MQMCMSGEAEGEILFCAIISRKLMNFSAGPLTIPATF